MHPLIHRRLLPLLALAGGLCGCGTFQPGAASSSNAVFAIQANTPRITTNTQAQLTARGADGNAAAVVWTVTGGTNSAGLGEGRIDANGLYTPPSAVSASSIRVNITAALESNPAITATTTVDITPGFIQSLLPENAAVAAGGSVDVKAEIAEVGSGNVTWKLASSPAGSGDASAPGTLTPASCERGDQQYTTCRATYTAPAGLNTPASVYITAAVNGAGQKPAVLHVLLNSDGPSTSPALNQSAQVGPIKMGSSGGNEGDYDTFQTRAGSDKIADCCGGTLGALLKDTSGNEYLLSNNHVLAESDQAQPGDSIIQPGLIDDACRPAGEPGSAARPVGVLKTFAPLSSPDTNVDAAIAAAAPGAVDSSGSILSFGTATAGGALDPAPPVAGSGEALTAANLGGLRVAKSGRTTGLTCSTVNTVDLSVKVDYFKDCAETEPYTTKTFTGQIGIAGDSFSDSGDSGSLVVDAANAEPVGLFFASGTDGQGSGMSIANPIGDVLAQLSAQAGSRLTVAGTATPHAVSCLNYEVARPATALSAEAESLARHAALSAGALLMNRESGVLGVAPGRSADSPGAPAVIVYTGQQKPFVDVPQTIDGVRTVVLATDADSVSRGSAPTTPATVAGIHLSVSALAHAAAVQQQVAAGLLSDPAVFGVGVTQSEDNPAEAALLVLIDMNEAPRSLPATAGGLRIRYLRLHRFHVTRSKYATAASSSRCSFHTAQ